MYKPTPLFLLPSGELTWEVPEPVPVQRVRGSAQRQRGSLGGGGADPLHLRQAEPGHRLRSGHERDRRARLLHVRH